MLSTAVLEPAVACDKVCIDSHEQVNDAVLSGNEEAVARHLIQLQATGLVRAFPRGFGQRRGPDVVQFDAEAYDLMYKARTEPER